MANTVRQNCLNNREVLGGTEKAEQTAEAIRNNDAASLPKEAYKIIDQLAQVSSRNMR